MVFCVLSVCCCFMCAKFLVKSEEFLFDEDA